MTSRVFVSYRRDHSKHAAGGLAERLDERFTLFMDVDRIRPGVVRPERKVALAFVHFRGAGRRCGHGGDKRCASQKLDEYSERCGSIPKLIVGRWIHPSKLTWPPGLRLAGSIGGS